MITENVNINSADMDLLAIPDLLNLINIEDHYPPIAVRRVIPDIVPVVEYIVNNFPIGGRILYIGAGTSGRIAFMDAAECPPTFGIDSERIQVKMAGGYNAVFHAAEGLEDSSAEGAEAVREWKAGKHDCVIGMSASGRTPYVLAGLQEAKKVGAYTALICSNNVSKDIADSIICCMTGPEILAGSTRLKAGSAAKNIVNMISTASMVKLGRTFGNRMCYIKDSNEKLHMRACATISECCNITEEESQVLFKICNKNLALSLVSGISGLSPEISLKALRRTDGNVREAIKLLVLNTYEGTVVI